jgi:hypothetical protein
VNEGEVSSGDYGRLQGCSTRRIGSDTAIRLRVSREGTHGIEDGNVDDRRPARVNEAAARGSADGLKHVSIPLHYGVSGRRLRLNASRTPREYNR